jgi:hypothetical protein
VDRQELALESRRTAEDIFAFVAARAHAAAAAGPRDARGGAVVAESTAFQDEFAVRFADRIQYLIIRLSAAGFSTDRLDPLSYAGTDRLGAGAAAETLQAISDELI